MELAALVVFAGALLVAAASPGPSYVLAAARARVLFRSPRALRLLNRSAGTLMAGAAVAVATK